MSIFSHRVDPRVRGQVAPYYVKFIEKGKIPDSKLQLHVFEGSCKGDAHSRINALVLVLYEGVESSPSRLCGEVKQPHATEFRCNVTPLFLDGENHPQTAYQVKVGRAHPFITPP